MMENTSFSNQRGTNLLPLRIPALQEIDLKSLGDLKNVQSYFPLPLSTVPFNLRDVAEAVRNQPFFDYNQIIQVSKNLKSIDPKQQSQIESFLASKESKVPSNMLRDIIQGLSKKDENNNQEKDQKLGEDNETLSESASEDYNLIRPDKENLLDNIKENLNIIMTRDEARRKSSEKRWWTPEEVQFIPFLSL